MDVWDFFHPQYVGNFWNQDFGHCSYGPIPLKSRPPRWHPRLELLPALLCDVHVRHLGSSCGFLFKHGISILFSTLFFLKRTPYCIPPHPQKKKIFRKEHTIFFFRLSAAFFFFGSGSSFMECWKIASTCLSFMCQAPVK